MKNEYYNRYLHDKDLLEKDLKHADKEKERAKIESKLAQFKASGGDIVIVSQGATGNGINGLPKNPMYNGNQREKLDRLKLRMPVRGRT